MSGRIGTIAILTHLRQGLDPDYFVARCMRQCWLPEGRRVIVHQGLRPPPPADLAIMHVDLTLVPEEYVALTRAYPYCLNARITDVSKRRISRWLVSAEDAYDGPVMVKHNLNHSGHSERRLRRAEGRIWARLREAARRWLPRAWGGAGGPEYQVFARKAQVPRWVWRSTDLVVERLFVEKHGEYFLLHQWQFMGPRSLVSSLLGPTPLVKRFDGQTRLPKHHRVPEALWRRRGELGIDFGKIDFVLHDGEPIVFDVNPTPHWGTTRVVDGMMWNTGVLAAGIDFFAEG
jgi:hypothetical protein